MISTSTRRLLGIKETMGSVLQQRNCPCRGGLRVRVLLGLLLTITFVEFVGTTSAEVSFSGEESPSVTYSLGKLSSALSKSTREIEIELKLDPSHLDGPESYSLEKRDQRLVVTSADPQGLMYGALGLAEAIDNGVSLDRLKPIRERPRFAFRAIKFNLPWDPYRTGEASTQHLETCRDLAFWEAFLDMMAENRFNTLTLWNPHPFNYLVRTKNFPEACEFNDQELAEWQAFWHALFEMADARSIDVFLVNWNVIVSKAFERAHPDPRFAGARVVGEAPHSEMVNDYLRESITQVLKEYPSLDGLGISLGDRMGKMTPKQREQWVLDVVIPAMRTAGRPVKLIHRVPFTASSGTDASTSRELEQMTRDAIEKIEGIERPIYVEVKFNWSHAHSAPQLVQVHGGSISDAYWNPPPKNYKITWMARNEDFFCLRWGNPDFIRQHIALNGQAYVGGYYLGSECYIPAKDYFQQPGLDAPWNYAFQRQWYYYKTWGQLLYNPDTPNAVFTAEFENRYGNDGKALKEALELGSRMPLRFASLVRSTWDYTLYSEGMLATSGPAALDKSSPFLSVEELIESETLAPDYVSIKQFVNASLKQVPTKFPPTFLTPIQLAEQLETDGRRIFELLDTIETPAKNSALAYEMVDARAWGWLSLYFAEKIRGGIALYRYHETQNPVDQQSATAHLTLGLEYWDHLVTLTRPVYRDMPLIHTGNLSFHWANYRDQVKRDLRLVTHPVLLVP